MIAPDPVVGDVHSLFALTGGLGQRAVHAEDRRVEEGVGLLGPNAEASLVDGVNERLDTRRREAVAKVARIGGIRDFKLF